MNIQDVLPDPEWMKPQLFYGKELRFSPKTHRYSWDGKHVPSVTTILRRLDKPALIQWAANCAVDYIKEKGAFDGSEIWGVSAVDLEAARKAHTVIRDTAGDVGTQVHEIARLLLQGAPPSYARPLGLPEQASKALLAFEEWRNFHRVIPVALERRVMSAELMYAGTCDFYGWIDDEPAILDFKTGNGVWDEAWFQLAGYERALWEELRFKDRLAHWVVHLNKTTGKCAAYRRGEPETTAALDVWEGLVVLDKALRAMPKMERRAA